MCMTKRELLKENMLPLFNMVKKLNLYIVYLNKSSRMDFNRVHNEIKAIKKQLAELEKCLDIEGTQQKLDL